MLLLIETLPLTTLELHFPFCSLEHFDLERDFPLKHKKRAYRSLFRDYIFGEGIPYLVLQYFIKTDCDQEHLQVKSYIHGL